jgi:hypothetical protein
MGSIDGGLSRLDLSDYVCIYVFMSWQADNNDVNEAGAIFKRSDTQKRSKSHQPYAKEM